jgi:3-deoxy-D-manno-octulosonate 8-phosphate phosphatase KdsC-like HAD superfamily phosphatase
MGRNNRAAHMHKRRGGDNALFEAVDMLQNENRRYIKNNKLFYK